MQPLGNPGKTLHDATGHAAVPRDIDKELELDDPGPMLCGRGLRVEVAEGLVVLGARLTAWSREIARTSLAAPTSWLQYEPEAPIFSESSS